MCPDKKQSFLVLSAFVLLLAVKDCHSELMCYVCDECPIIKADTPLVTCNEDYFNKVGAQLPSMTTTSPTTSSTTEEMMQGDDPMAMTPEASPSSSTTTTTEGTTTTKTTVGTTKTPMKNATVATTAGVNEMTSTTQHSMMPPTTEFVSTRTTSSTPTTEAAETTKDQRTTRPTQPTRPESDPIDTETTATTIASTHLEDANSTMHSTVMHPSNTFITIDSEEPVLEERLMTTPRSYMNSSTFRVRQERHVMPPESATKAMTFHCYTMQVVSNSSLMTRRGCARVPAAESVCELLKLSSSATPVNKCQDCAKDRCNGSGALGVSLSAMLLVMVAALLKQH